MDNVEQSCTAVFPPMGQIELGTGIGGFISNQPIDGKKDPWMHRADMMHCHTCMWFVEKVGIGGPRRIGRCRRHAPSMNGYPVVYLNDWCGDHKLDENKG